MNSLHLHVLRRFLGYLGTLGLLACLLLPVGAAVYDPRGNWLEAGTPAPGKPALVQSPRDTLARPGGNAFLSVTATGYPLGYQWFFNGTALSQGTNDTLNLRSLTENQFGAYQVVIRNAQGSVTSTVARLEIDRDLDSLPDSWEVTYFGSITNQTALTDADKDGVDNRQEYLDGTLPDVAGSLRPRMGLYASGGVIRAEPWKESYATNEVVQLTAQPELGLEFLGWSGDLTATTNPSALLMSKNRGVQATFGRPLAEALGVTNLFRIGGIGGWLGQQSVTHDGLLAAATAPAILPAPLIQISWMETQVQYQKDGLVRFWWKVDANSENRLVLLVDGKLEFSNTRVIAGRVGWVQKGLFLKAGVHTLRWQYERVSDSYYTPESNQTVPSDAAYVDQLEWLDGYSPALDTDSNGLSDLAEYQYFDGLGNDPDADPDFDNVVTRLELQDGTNPLEFTSVNPRVTYVVEGGGTAQTTPSLPFYTRNQTVTHGAVAAVDAGWRFYAWVGPFNTSSRTVSVVTNATTTDTLPVAKVYRAIFGLPVGGTLDSGGLAWTSGGAMPWYGQTNDTRVGVSAARSGPALAGEAQSWLETTVTGPGTLEFQWRVDSPTNSDHLVFEIGQTERARISGLKPWESLTFLLPPGSQKLRWTYKRFFGFNPDSQNSGWLDGVRFTPGSIPPTVRLLSAGGAYYQGDDVAFRLESSGTPPIQHQLIFQGNPVGPLSSLNTLWLSNVTPALSGSWRVAAYNSAGTNLSVPIEIQVLPLPPVNDAFAAPTLLPGPLPFGVRGYTRGATAEAAERNHSKNDPLHSVWYRWTSTLTGKVRISLASTNAEGGLIVAVYRGSTLGSLVEMAGDEEYGQDENGVDVTRLALVFDAITGTTYHVVVDSTYGQGDLFDLSWERVPPPANDPFAGRFQVAGPLLSLSGDTRLGTRETGEPNLGGLFFNIASNSLWWEWTAPVSGSVEFKVTGSGSSPVVTVYEPGNVLASLQELGNSLFGASQSVQFDAVAGQKYPVSVRALDRAGTFVLTIAMETLLVQAERRVSDGKLVLTVQGPAGRTVDLESSTDLEQWESVLTGEVGEDGRWVLVQPPGSEGLSRQFYRAQLR